MAFPLGTVLAAAPGIITAAADVIKLIRNRKQPDEPAQNQDPRVEELALLIEKQAMLIEELAKNNRELALSVQSNRRFTMLATGLSVLAVVLVLFLA